MEDTKLCVAHGIDLSKYEDGSTFVVFKRYPRSRRKRIVKKWLNNPNNTFIKVIQNGS